MLYWVNKCLALEVPWKCCWVLSHWWILRNRSAGFAVLALPPVFLTALDHSKPQSASTWNPLYIFEMHSTLFYLPWNCSSPAQRGEGCWGMWLSWCPCGVLPGASVGWPTLRSVSSLHTGSMSTFNWGAWPLSLWDLRALHSTLFRLGKLGRTRCGSFTGKYV